MCRRLGLFLLVAMPCVGYGQSPPVTVHEGVDPTWVRSAVVLDIGSYVYHQPARFYAATLRYHYGLQNKQHLFGLAIPFVHSVYDQDLRGFENTVGLGDIRMYYRGRFNTGETTGITHAAPSLEISAPTGAYLLGRSAGAWLYQPGMSLVCDLHPNLSMYPALSFQFSGVKVNSLAGAHGTPDPQNTDRDTALRNMHLTLPMMLKLDGPQAWFGIVPEYITSFSEREYFIFFGTEAGMMLADKTLGMLRVTKFVAGLPRVNIVAEARLQFFL